MFSKIELAIYQAFGYEQEVENSELWTYPGYVQRVGGLGAGESGKAFSAAFRAWRGSKPLVDVAFLTDQSFTKSLGPDREFVVHLQVGGKLPEVGSNDESWPGEWCVSNGVDPPDGWRRAASPPSPVSATDRPGCGSLPCGDAGEVGSNRPVPVQAPPPRFGSIIPRRQQRRRTASSSAS